jgi:hypothetical protein
MEPGDLLDFLIFFVLYPARFFNQYTRIFQQMQFVVYITHKNCYMFGQ